MKQFSAILVGVFVLLAGCKDGSMGPVTADQNALVILTASAGVSAGPVQLGKTTGFHDALASVESLTVQSATIVLKDIAFMGVIDTVHTRDSVQCGRDDDAEEHEFGMRVGRLRFKGPFLVDLQNNTPTQIALDTIPPGNYTGIKFVIHKLRHRDVMMNPAFPDSLVGYSIVVRGIVQYSDTTKVPFVFKADIDEEFKVKGNFVVAPGDKLVPYVLNFDMASWFTDGRGRILDPNNRWDRWAIRWAIKAALKGRVCGGRDHNWDGRPD